LLKNIRSVAKELLFPKRCFFCKKHGELLCCDCKELFEISPVHHRARAETYLTDIYAACSYENTFVKILIHNLKYAPFCKELAIPAATLIADHFKLSEQSINFNDSIIIPVPLAKKRLRWRGYNQAEAIARELERIWLVPTTSDCLKRHKETKTQAELSKSERRENIKKAFTCENSALLKDKSIFLIDDVITTGATISECANVLLKNGAREVLGIAVARAEN